MEFDSRMISIVGVILVLSLSYFVYLIYQDVLSLKSQVDEIRSNLIITDEDDDEELDSEDEYDSEAENEDEEDEQYDEEDEQYDEEVPSKVEKEFGRIFDIEEEPEAEAQAEVEEKAEEKVPVETINGLPVFGPEPQDPSVLEMTNTSFKKKRRTVKKK